MWFRFTLIWTFAISLSAVHSVVVAGPIGPNFEEVSAAVLPTTVHIRVEKGTQVSAGIQQMARDYALPVPRGEHQVGRHSTGSGVIFDHRGLVLTNHHVIDGAKNIRITLYDQQVYEAQVLGTDPKTDVAVLQIIGDGPFAAASIGDSDGLRVGQWVIAVGHPFDFPFTVTAGIVSALGRRDLGKNEIQDYIQTDVAVNPGSSGGPLFNRAGMVVGINTAIFSPDKDNLASAGISFAIPSRMAVFIASQLAEKGAVAYSGIGVATQDKPATATDPRPGATITQVRAGSPADSAGLRRGDVIVSVDGEPTPGSQAFQSLVLTKPLGATLRIDHVRGNKNRSVRVKTVDTASIGASTPHEEPDAVHWRGMHVVDATAKRLTRRGIAMPPDQQSGVLVTMVAPNSPADLAGILPGDVLLQIHKTPMKGVDDLISSVENKGVVLVSFWRGGSRYLAAVASRAFPE